MNLNDCMYSMYAASCCKPLSSSLFIQSFSKSKNWTQGAKDLGQDNSDMQGQLKCFTSQAFCLIASTRRFRSCAGVGLTVMLTVSVSHVGPAAP